MLVIISPGPKDDLKFMQSRRHPSGPEDHISLLGDVDGIDSLGHRIRQDAAAAADALDTAGAPRQSLNPRVQFLRLSSIVRGRVGVFGATPPYQPAAPSLYRPLDGDHEQDSLRSGLRAPSPLQRHVVLDQHRPRADDSRRPVAPATATRLSRLGSYPSSKSVKMPQTGFQALILCGPGIGLSTFTSVPAEFPKALVELANRPMVWYVLDWCYRMGVTDITLITPSTAKDPLAAALAQNPYLTALPSPTPDLLAPAQLEFTTPTAELLRLPEVQAVIKSDFVLLPCDLVCDVPGEKFLESYLTRLGPPAGIGSSPGAECDASRLEAGAGGGETRGRHGGLSVWYNTSEREESVKGEECDFMCTAKLDPQHDLPLSKTASFQFPGVLRKLVWTMPMSELWDQCEHDKSWKIRQSLLRRHGTVKCLTRYRDSHIYFFPHWVKHFASRNPDFESVSEDLVGTWAKAEWRKPGYRARFGVTQIFTATNPSHGSEPPTSERPLEDEIDLMSLSSTQISTAPVREPSRVGRTARLASRVQAEPEDSVLSPDDGSRPGDGEPVPVVPPILSYVLPSDPDATLVRRVDTTPLLLSVSLCLAKLPSIEESLAAKLPASPFAHLAKIHPTATVAPRVTISRSDTLIDSNSTIATQSVIKSSVIGSSVAIGTGTRITNCLIMDGATVGDKCVLTNTVIGKKAKIGNKCALANCEVQDGNMVVESTEGKGEKYLVGGLEDEMDGEDGMNFDDDEAGDDDGQDAELRDN